MKRFLVLITAFLSLKPLLFAEMLLTARLILELLAVFLLLVASFYFYHKWMYGHWKRRGIPYIPPTIPFGNLENPINKKDAIGVRFKQLYDEFKSKGCKYGGIFSMNRPKMLIIDPELVRCILTKDFQHFTDRGLYSNEEVDPLSGHLFMLSGTKWRNLRIKLTPTFTSGKMKMMFFIMAECSNQLLSRVDNYAKDHLPVDIKEVLACFTTDVIGCSAFGLECNSLKVDDAVFRKYGRKILDPSAFELIRRVFVISFPEIAGKIGIKQMNKDIENFFINTVKETVEYRESTKYTRNDFMQLLINIKNSEDGNGMTIKEMAAQTFVFFVAGFETSSSAMSFCLYELSVNQEIQEKLRNEIRHVLKLHQGVMSYEAIQEMKYLGQVLDGNLIVLYTERPTLCPPITL